MITNNPFKQNKAMANENVNVQEPKKANWFKRNWKLVVGLALGAATVVVANPTTRKATIAAGKNVMTKGKDLIGKIIPKKTKVNDAAIPTNEPVQVREYNNNQGRQGQQNGRNNWNNQQRHPKFN